MPSGDGNTYHIDSYSICIHAHTDSTPYIQFSSLNIHNQSWLFLPSIQRNLKLATPLTE